MSESSLMGEIAQLAEEYARHIRKIEERRAREILRCWLRPRLRWLANYPHFLKWYMKLPHKTTPVAVYELGEKGVFGPAEFKIMPKKDLR